MHDLFVDFINTGWHVTHEACRDPLLDGGWVSELLARAGADWDADQYDAGKMIGLRSDLSAAVDSVIEAGKPDSAEIDLLNKLLSGLPVLWRVEPAAGGFALVERPVHSGMEYAVYLILKSFAAFLAGGEAANLRRCCNGQCGWLFIDRSKSHTRKWCSNTCASLIKVRRHRNKRKDA